MASSLNWGIVSTGNIAKAFAKGVQGSKTGKLVAVGSRSQEKAQAFAKEFGIPVAHGSYEELFADPNVQAVYIATPHPQHAQWAIKAADAGKHILCEKPIGLNFSEASAIVEAAIRNDVFLMEAFMYRTHPQIAKLVELIRDRVIGDVRIIQATFSFQSGFNPEGRLFKNDLAGGGILDVGCYTTSIARLIAGAATGKPFAEPTEVRGTAHLGQTGVDEWAIASLKFPGGILAQLSTGVVLNQENVVRVFGSEGSIVLPTPWGMGREPHTTKIIVNRKGGEPQTIEVATDRGIYAIEADTVAQYLEQRQAASPAMSWDDSLGNMRTLDQWRQSIGLLYEQEKWGKIQTIHKRPLKVSPKNNMKYGRIAGIDKPVARLVMGAMESANFPPYAAAMWDDYFERGGNCLDTAYIYGGGNAERALGAWANSRGIRDQVIILDKGAHTPDCNPEDLTRQHKESLKRLDTEFVDIYMMHRDNPDIPVGEFVDVLNDHIRNGTMKAIGASNWMIERYQAFNEYARKNGKIGFSALSNNFSLARMVNPVWGGCLSVSDPESRRWLTQTQTAIMPWSSQARGFFTDRSGPDKLEDRELVNSWYSEDNFERKRRAYELAQKKGVTPVTIALAYVLHQPFPTFPLIGPRALSETRTSFHALDVELTADEVKWLNLELPAV